MTLTRRTRPAGRPSTRSPAELKGRSRETVVKIVADQMPVPPTQAQYGAVEFEGLTAIPYATDRGRVAYSSLRATGIKQAITRPAPGTEHAA